MSVPDSSISRYGILIGGYWSPGLRYFERTWPGIVTNSGFIAWQLRSGCKRNLNSHTHTLFPSICAHPSNRFPFSDLERLEIVFSTDRMFFHRYYKLLDFNVFDFETKFLSCPKLDQITRKQSPLKQGPREQFSRKRRIPDASSPLINKSSLKGRKRKKERKGRIVNRVLPRRVGV